MTAKAPERDVIPLATNFIVLLQSIMSGFDSATTGVDRLSKRGPFVKWKSTDPTSGMVDAFFNISFRTMAHPSIPYQIETVKFVWIIWKGLIKKGWNLAQNFN